MLIVPVPSPPRGALGSERVAGWRWGHSRPAESGQQGRPLVPWSLHLTGDVWAPTLPPSPWLAGSLRRGPSRCGGRQTLRGSYTEVSSLSARLHFPEWAFGLLGRGIGYLFWGSHWEQRDMPPCPCGRTRSPKGSVAVWRPKDPPAQDDLPDLMGRVLLTPGLCNSVFPNRPQSHPVT